MSELQRLVEADHRFEEATEMLRDLLDDKVRGRLEGAIKAVGGPEVKDLKAVLEFMDWLWMYGQDHLDGILADIHGIDLAQANREREGKAKEFAERIGVPPERLPIFARKHARVQASAARHKAAERCGHA